MVLIESSCSCFIIGVWVEEKQCLQGSLLPRDLSIHQGLRLNPSRIRRCLSVLRGHCEELHLSMVFLLALYGSDKIGSTRSYPVLLKATGE